mgnify:CR=1 FL=1
MAQNFRRYTSNNVGTSAATVFTADSYDTIVGISVANIAASTINVDDDVNTGTVVSTTFTVLVAVPALPEASVDV